MINGINKAHGNWHPLSKLSSGLFGPLLMLSAALQFTVMNLILKLMGPDFSTWHIAFYRFFGSVVLLIPICFLGHKGNPYRGHNYRLLILRGLTGSAAFLSIVAAIRLLPLSTTMVVFYTYPAFAAFFAVLLYKDHIRLKEIGCILMVVAGACLLFEFKASGRPLGEILALTGAVLFGLTVTLIRTLRQQNGPVIIYLYFCTVGALISLPAFLSSPRWPETPHQWLLCIVLIFFSVSAQLSMNYGFFYCRSWEGAMYMTTEAVFTFMVGVILLNEPLTWRLLVGGGIVFCGVFSMTIIRARANRQT